MALTRGDTRSRLRRGGEKEAMESAGMMRWLLTYADMITLLLALFIILFAISNISAVKFNKLARAISGGFNSTSSINEPPNGGTTGSERGRTDEANMAVAKSQLDRYIAQQNLQSKVQTSITKQGLVITLLSDKAYYNSGSADLRPETKLLLDVVAAQLRNVKNAVRVEGSTDNGQFHPRFPNDTDAHRQQNRRVDIVILNGQSAPTPIPETEANP